jgi:hypothetical protein
VTDRRVFGVEVRDGVFFCTVMAADGTVRAMRVFPPGQRGVNQFLRFAARQGLDNGHPRVGLLDLTSGPGGGGLARALEQEGFRVCPVCGELPAGRAAAGLALNGGRSSSRAARALLDGGTGSDGDDEP